MNKSNIIGLVIIVGLLIGYSIWMTPSKEQREQALRARDSVERVRKADSAALAIEMKLKKQIADSLAKASASNLNSSNDSIKSTFVNVSDTAKSFYTIENDLLKLTISSKGGKVWAAQLKEFQTFDSLPLILFKGDSTEFGFEFSTEDLKTVNTNNLEFIPAIDGQKSIKVSGNDSASFALRMYPSNSTNGKNSYIEYLYTLKGNDYMVGYKVSFVNMQNYLAQNMRDIAIVWNSSVNQHEKSFSTEQAQTTIYYMDIADEVGYLKETSSQKDRLSTAVKWVSFKQQFFSTTLIAGTKFESADVETIKYEEGSGRKLSDMRSMFVMAFEGGTDQTLNLNWYFGPNKYKILRKYDQNLERQIPLGWGFFLMQWINRYAVIPVFNWLETKAISYGIIILILTILLKIVLFPIAWKTYISSAKMRILKPEIEEINQKYPKKDDAMKKQQATMALYKKAGVNPMAGCVPMLLQFPILIAMFRFFPAAFELRQQPFLWATDLSSYDSILNLPFEIPFYGAHVSLFTLLMTISTIIYTKMNNDMMGSTQQIPGMKTMMYLMPVMFLGFFNNYSSGLSYYYLLANLFTFAQMYFIRRFVNEDKLHKRIQENKAKPVKKSSFQQRLEEMAKQQQQRKK